MKKCEIVAAGQRLGAPLHVTWSCYRDGDIACGRCDSCALRRRGFREAGVEDPDPLSSSLENLAPGNTFAVELSKGESLGKQAESVAGGFHEHKDTRPSDLGYPGRGIPVVAGYPVGPERPLRRGHRRGWKAPGRGRDFPGPNQGRKELPSQDDKQGRYFIGGLYPASTG